MLRERIVVTEVKFCGLTRAEDTTVAVSLAARYVGVVFAGGPRHLSEDHARAVLAVVDRSGVRKVGVFAAQLPAEIGRIAQELSLDVVQLNGNASRQFLDEVRRVFPGDVWQTLRVTADQLPENAATVFAHADRVVLDTMVPGRLGGSGVAFAWAAVAGDLARMRGSRPVVLAGGLRPDNVGAAIRILAPDVVDVSSGVEASPGVKDHARMRAFISAVAGIS